MGILIVVVTALMHLAVYLAGNELAYFPSLVAGPRNVVFVAAFVWVIHYLKRKYHLRVGSHVFYVAMLITAVGLTFQYRVSYDIWASSNKSSIAIANKRRFIRDKINILFIRQHPEFEKFYTPPDSPHEHITWKQELSEMTQTIVKMGLVIVAFFFVVLWQLKGKLAFWAGNWLLLGVMTFLFTVLLGGVTAVFGGASHGGAFLANMTPWEVIKIPLVLTMTGFVVATQAHFHGGGGSGGDKVRFILVLLLIYFTPLWIFLLIRDFGQLWIMTFFYTFAFYVSTRRVIYPLIGLAAVVMAFVLVLVIIPLINGLTTAIFLYNAFWPVAIVGALGVFSGYFWYAYRTQQGSWFKLSAVIGAMVAWVFMAYAVPPYLITLFGVGETSPTVLSRNFMELPVSVRAKFLQHARSLTADLSTLLNFSDEPEELAVQLVSLPREELERRLEAWNTAEHFGLPNPPVQDMAAILQEWPEEEVEGLLGASPRFRQRLARQLGTIPRISSMQRKIDIITRESLVSRMNAMGTWEPSPSLGVLATPMRRITSWWLMWDILSGKENPEIYDEQGPYWRTLEHLFRGFFAMEHGGWLGQGIGLGNPTFVPKAINDFVYVTLAEELGWIGTLIILLLYTALIWTMIVVGQGSTDSYWRLVTVLFAILFWAQVFVNVGGVVGFIPLTGIPLPFISRGFFSMLTSFVALGLVVGIAHSADQEREMLSNAS